MYGVEVTLAAETWVGVQLCDGDMKRGEAVGIIGALHVALEHADADTLGPSGERALEQRGLARTRGAHQVDHGHPMAIEVGAIRAGDRVVGVQRVLDDPHLGAMHAGSSSSTSM